MVQGHQLGEWAWLRLKQRRFHPSTPNMSPKGICRDAVERANLQHPYRLAAALLSNQG
jgi:hypothetical protein